MIVYTSGKKGGKGKRGWGYLKGNSCIGGTTNKITFSKTRSMYNNSEYLLTHHFERLRETANPLKSKLHEIILRVLLCYVYYFLIIKDKVTTRSKISTEDRAFVSEYKSIFIWYGTAKYHRTSPKFSVSSLFRCTTLVLLIADLP